MSVMIRPEDRRDFDHVRVVNERAFEGPDEAAIVEALRGISGALSLVAADGDRIVGHILFTPVQIESRAMAIRAVGLAPMAVLPEYQRRGIGSELVRRGLDMCRASGQDAVVVVGHPTYYPRFGFVPAFTKGLECEFTVAREAFMVLELRAGALAGAHGVVRYRPEFAAV
jgi:putative acetyltransferase